MNSALFLWAAVDYACYLPECNASAVHFVASACHATTSFGQCNECQHCYCAQATCHGVRHVSDIRHHSKQAVYNSHAAVSGRSEQAKFARQDLAIHR